MGALNTGFQRFWIHLEKADIDRAMTNKPHPIFVLLGILFLGILVWPFLKYNQLAPRGMLADGLVVCVLIGGYYFYKNWYDGQTKK